MILMCSDERYNTILCNFEDHTNKLDPPTKRILNSIGTDIVAMLNWIEKGRIIDNNKVRMDIDWHEAEIQVSDALKNSLSDYLKKLTIAQAKLFWNYRGCKEDNNIKRIKDDYYDAKRHIGFLLADKLLNHCIAESKQDQCLVSIKKAYIGYLITISIEEYIRIKAYLTWEKSGGIANNDKMRMDFDYYEAVKNIDKAMINCKSREKENFVNDIECAKYIKDYVKLVNSGEMDKVRKAKIYSGERLKYDVSLHVKKYVNDFYILVEHALDDVEGPDKSKIQKLINEYYDDYHVPNMFEFVMRCFLCAYVGKNGKEKIAQSVQLSRKNRLK